MRMKTQTTRRCIVVSCIIDPNDASEGNLSTFTVETSNLCTNRPEVYQCLIVRSSVFDCSLMMNFMKITSSIKEEKE